MSDKFVSRKDLLTGGILVLVGFALAVGWEVWKDDREVGRRDKALNAVVTSDLKINKTQVEFSLKLLSEELAALAEDRSVVQPLPVLQDRFWDVVKLNPPTDLIMNGKLEKLNKLMSVTSIVNEQVRSRENYRLHNGAMTNFRERMRKYDELLIRQLIILKVQIDEFEK
jgi:hypothetical protein